MTVTDKIDTVEALVEYLMMPWPELATPLRRVHSASLALGDSPHADLLRMDACHRVRLAQDRIFASADDPVPAYAAVLDAVATGLEAAGRLPLAASEVAFDATPSEKDATATHYGKLWGDFSPAHYFDEATALLRTRLERNGFDLSSARHQRVLDAGCGGGRYSVALSRLGFGKVVGLDWSTQGIALATERAAQAGVRDVTYVTGDVLALPFEDREFDVVFSNGVLHHTTDTRRGVREMARVLKPGGRAWLYLYHRPGGLDRLTQYFAHLLLRRARHEVCRRYCNALGLPGNRVFFLLDLWLTPICEAYTPAEMDEMLRDVQFKHWRRAERGADYDAVERLFQREPNADRKYGVGENRYIIDA
jgi:ubiquinone/menaquinone biosynthesis C-methylase UbiE